MGPWALLISLNEKCRSRRGRENETAAQTAVSLRILSAFPTPFRGEILGAAVTMVNKLIPDDMELQTGDLPNYTTSDGSLRLKIIGTRVDATEIEKA
ncbi:hypothetical protein CUMW_119240 [Citrus unshiu]|nr:hypothetical protein CUMW_119240 [Citrus unshiu]